MRSPVAESAYVMYVKWYWIWLPRFRVAPFGKPEKRPFGLDALRKPANAPGLRNVRVIRAGDEP